MKHHRCITLGVQCCVPVLALRVARALRLRCSIGVASSDKEKMADRAVKQMQVVIS